MSALAARPAVGERAPVALGPAVAGMACLALGAWVADAAPGTVHRLGGLWLAHGLGLGLLLWAVRPKLTGRAVAVALVLAAALPLALAAQRVLDPPAGDQLAGNDGGVWATEIAARDAVAGRNPYAADITDRLPSEWHRITRDGRTEVDNPIRWTYPYLPGAFLAVAPGTVLEGPIPHAGDPRLVMGATFVAALVLVARRGEAAPWARVAALASLSGPIVAVHLAFGTNDTWTGSLVVLAALLAARRPRLAGVLLALAVSIKVLVVVAVVPFGVWVWRHGGRDALGRWWTFPATLAVTGLPFLLADPGAMVDDTVLYWAGRSEHPFPAGGIGLAASQPDIFHGPVLAVTVVGLLVAGLAAAVALARRVDHPAILPVATAVPVLAILLPARTFQDNYLVLLAGLLAAGWLVVGARGEAAEIR